MLYAPPVNRGNVCLLEDFPELNNIKITMKVEEKMNSIISVPDNSEIKFTQNDNVISFTVDSLKLHKLIAIKY